MTNKEKAEAYVREKCPELMELSRNCAYRRKATKGRWFDHVLDRSVSFENLCGCTKGMLTTQAFTSYKCGLCKQGKSWPNGMRPKWCPECAKERGVCLYCKAPLEIIGHPIQPYHYLKVIVEATKDHNWMLNHNIELVNMKNFGNRHFKNDYLIIGTERFYQAFNQIVGIN